MKCCITDLVDACGMFYLGFKITQSGFLNSTSLSLSFMFYVNTLPQIFFMMVIHSNRFSQCNNKNIIEIVKDFVIEFIKICNNFNVCMC